MFTEVMARMTLANSYGILGREAESQREFERAAKLLKELPSAERYLKVLENNHRNIQSSSARPQSGMLVRWILSILAIIFGIIIIIYLLKLA